MLKNQIIQITLLSSGCFFCMITAYCMYISNNFDKEKRKWLIFMQISTALLLAGDACAYIFRGYPGKIGFVCVRISNFLVFALSVVILCFFHSYVCSYLFRSRQALRLQRVKAAYIFCVIALALVIISQFTNLYYYFDAQNYYHRSHLYMLSMLLPEAVMFIDLSLLLQYRQKLRRRILWSMTSYISFPLIAAAIQAVCYGISLINLSICLSVIIMFVASIGEQNYEMYQILKKKSKIEERLEISSTLNQCVKVLLAEDDIDHSFHNLFEIINRYFDGDRTYLFEVAPDKNKIDNTYEYVKEGITPQIQNLQGLDLSVIDGWMEYFKKDKPYYMSKLEQEDGHESYEVLQEQDVNRLLAVPIKEQNKFIGFLGVDNPRNHYEDATLLSSIQYFIINSLKAKAHHQELQYLSYRDMLTGLYNRNKYIIMVDSYSNKEMCNVGTCYIDLNGLKKMNDQFGHEAGDRLIKIAADIMSEVFEDHVYRIGGDEFVIVVQKWTKEDFEQQITNLKHKMAEQDISASFGMLWKSSVDDLTSMLKQADFIMYQEKKQYHLQNG